MKKIAALIALAGIASVASAQGRNAIDVMLSTDGGVTWLPLALATPNDGTQTITVPSTPSTTSRVRVSEAAGSLADSSDGDFTIQYLFGEISSGVAGADYSFLAWGDYDSDGDLDIALAGGTLSGKVARLSGRVLGAQLLIFIFASVPISYGEFDRPGG